MGTDYDMGPDRERGRVEAGKGRKSGNNYNCVNNKNNKE